MAATKTKKAEQRKDLPHNYWHASAKPVEFGREQFRLTTLAGGKHVDLRLDDVVESFEWAEDNKHVLSGTITVRRSDKTRHHDLRVGQEVRCEVAPWGSAKWSELWRMRITSPSYSLGAHQYTFELADDLIHLSRSQDDFKYRKDKAHPKGWLGHEVILDICKRYGIEVGRLPKMTHRVKKLSDTGVSPLSVIEKVLRYERVDNAHRYFIRWLGGKLNIVPFHRSEELLLFAGTVIDGTLTETLKDNFATVLDVTATADKGKTKDAKGNHKHKKEKLHVTVQTKRGISLYGYVRRKVHAPHADSIADVRKWAKRKLARVADPNREFSFTHPGIARLRRGAAVSVTIPEAGFVAGKERRIIYVSEIHHTVSPGDYTMEVTVQFTDPYVVKAKPKKKDKKKAKPKKANQRSTK